MSSEGRPNFARVSRTGEELAELRVNSPKHILSVIDAVAISETKASGKLVSRTDIVNRILGTFVDHKIDETSLINNALGINPTVLDN